MKKIFSIIITVILLCSFIACNKKESVSKSKEEFFIAEAIHLTRSMDILAESKEYRSFMASPDETELVKRIGYL